MPIQYLQQQSQHQIRALFQRSLWSLAFLMWTLMGFSARHCPPMFCIYQLYQSFFVQWIFMKVKFKEILMRHVCPEQNSRCMIIQYDKTPKKQTTVFFPFGIVAPCDQRGSEIPCRLNSQLLCAPFWTAWSFSTQMRSCLEMQSWKLLSTNVL